MRNSADDTQEEAELCAAPAQSHPSGIANRYVLRRSATIGRWGMRIACLITQFSRCEFATWLCADQTRQSPGASGISCGEAAGQCRALASGQSC